MDIKFIDGPNKGTTSSIPGDDYPITIKGYTQPDVGYISESKNINSKFVVYYYLGYEFYGIKQTYKHDEFLEKTKVFE